jgi:hypothetical protein
MVASASSNALPVPEGQVNQEIFDLEDLIAIESEIVENRVNPGLVAIAAPPPGFLGERLVSIQDAPKDFHGERLTSSSSSGGAEVTNENPGDGSYSFRYLIHLFKNQLRVRICFVRCWACAFVYNYSCCACAFVFMFNCCACSFCNFSCCACNFIYILSCFTFFMNYFL